MGVSPRFFGMSHLVTFLILLSAIVVQFHNIEVAGCPDQPMNKKSGMDQDHEQDQEQEQDQNQDQDHEQDHEQDHDQDQDQEKNVYKHVLRLSPCWSVGITPGSVVLSPWYLSPRGKTHCCCAYTKHCAPPKKVRKCGWTTSPCYLACALLSMLKWQTQEQCHHQQLLNHDSMIG